MSQNQYIQILNQRNENNHSLITFLKVCVESLVNQVRNENTVDQ